MNPQVKCIIGHRRTRGFGGSRSILAPTDHLAIGSKAMTWSTPGPVWVASAGLSSIIVRLPGSSRQPVVVGARCCPTLLATTGPLGLASDSGDDNKKRVRR
jgi:hypothetical protein